MSTREPRIYGRWAGNLKGYPEDTTRCVEGVGYGERAGLGRQCDRKRGHGPDGLYCKQHDPEAVATRRKAADERYEADARRRLLPFVKADERDAALIEIAKHLDPQNENVKRGYLVAAIRDLAQIALTNKGLVEDCEKYCLTGLRNETVVDPLREAARQAVEETSVVRRAAKNRGEK